jgi:hypothetical protein
MGCAPPRPASQSETHNGGKTQLWLDLHVSGGPTPPGRPSSGTGREDRRLFCAPCGSLRRSARGSALQDAEAPVHLSRTGQGRYGLRLQVPGKIESCLNRLDGGVGFGLKSAPPRCVVKSLISYFIHISIHPYYSRVLSSPTKNGSPPPAPGELEDSTFRGSLFVFEDFSFLKNPSGFTLVPPPSEAKSFRTSAHPNSHYDLVGVGCGARCGLLL